MHRAQRRHRLLKNHRDFAAANRTGLRAHGVNLGHIDDLIGYASVLLPLQVEQNLALYNPSRRWHDRHD